MKTFSIKLLKREQIAHNTYAFYFEKPQDFTYQAGQYVSFSVDSPEVAAPGGTMRELSLASAPYEPVLATAIRFRESKAKQQFMKLPIGETMYLQGPFGDFHLVKNSAPLVFLAGGIGITPFLSLIKQALHDTWKNEMFIFFSNRQKEDIPFLPELNTMREQKQIQLINTLTKTSADDWREETGYITKQMIKRYVPRPQEAYYYISGPLGFVGGMWDVLEELTVADKQIRGEEFTGY